jgi:heme/copper-type cytochrome/quinol oxidase subunit 2
MNTTRPKSNSGLNIALILVAVLFWLAASVYVYENGVSWFMPDAASVEARAVDDLFRFMLGIGTFVFLLVQSLLFYFIVRYGFFRNHEDESDAAHIHGNTTLEIVWTLIPSIIVFILTVYSFQVLVDTTEAKDDEFAIEVTGKRFFWQFRYPDEEFDLVQNHVLVVPEGETIRLEMTSEDVIHAFWVPAFRVKQDVMPGRVSELRFTPNTLTGLPPDAELVSLEDLEIPGPDTACPAEEAQAEAPVSEASAMGGADQADIAQQGPPVDYKTGYDLVCAELCGGNHGLMRGEIFVVTREEYEAYVESLRAKAVQAKAEAEYADRCGGTALLAAGRSLFNLYGCNTCHMLNDAGSLAMGQGPSLNGIGARAATDHPDYASAEDYIRTSIINPNVYIVPGYAAGLMPMNFADQMTPEELNRLVKYLALQTEG